MKMVEYNGIPLKVNTNDKPKTTPGIANESKLIKCNALLEIFFPERAVTYAAKYESTVPNNEVNTATAIELIKNVPKPLEKSFRTCTQVSDISKGYCFIKP